MQFLKPFISLFLLLTYSVGFVQGMSSNCNHYSVVLEKENGEHQHNHHVHDGSELENHEHVQHRDHFDESAFDLLMCVLEDATDAHSGSDNCHCLPATSSRTAADQLAKMKLLAVLVPHFFRVEKQEITVEYFCSPTIGFISDSFAAGLSQRGPPTFS